LDVLGTRKNSGGCWDGELGNTVVGGARGPGEADFDRGRVACADIRGRRIVYWMDAEDLTYGVMVSDLELRSAVTWWGQWATRRPIYPLFWRPEQDLLGLVDPSLRPGCVPFRHALLNGWRFGRYYPSGDDVAIKCFAPDGSRPVWTDVEYFRFKSVGDLGTWFRDRIDDVTPALRNGGCRDGRPGIIDWARGQVACFRTSDGHAAIRWTDTSDSAHPVYGAVSGRDASIASLYAQWIATLVLRD
jgi:hypothetical protein